MSSFYVTTAIPYVNAAPHLGHALELVQADVLARHRRRRGGAVRFLTGTDDNALKNVTAAQAAGVPTRAFVAANAARFAALRGPLALSFDDFISTSTDPRHAAGVRRLWKECAHDFYRRRYEGRYCAGCEQFLDGLVCPEHAEPSTPVAEENWFFRLSRYQNRLLALLESRELDVVPAVRRNEVLAFVRAGLLDISVSRPAARADGWGIPVPGDPSQVVYVWWDALANYVTALGFGPDYERWWVDAERVHVIGKGIVRFHAVYWAALLLSAGRPLPTRIFVHDYLTVDGAKISKSSGTAVDPGALADEFGTDAVRWWLLREPAPNGTTDFTVDRLVRRSNQDLANGIGNLVNRVTGLLDRGPGSSALAAFPLAAFPLAGSPLAGSPLAGDLPGRIDRALAAFDFRAATEAIIDVVDRANRLIESERPWELTGASRERVLATLLGTAGALATELEPFLPDGAARLQAQLGNRAAPGAAFPRLIRQ
jgi:methionyl-tRNA synthetase